MITPAPQRRWTAALRWGVAALAVTTAHGVGAWMALNWRPAAAAAGAPEQAVMIELAALSVAPEAPPENLPVAQERVELEQPPEPVKEPPPEPEPEPPPPEPVLDIPLEQPPPDPQLTHTPEPEIKMPELPSIPDAAAVLTPPPPPKKEVAKPKPKPKPKPRVVERKPEVPRARQAAAPPPSPAPASAPSAAAQGAAEQPSVSPASWRGTLIAHLNRHKRFPGGANPGTAQVAFTIDRAGRVLAARLVGSSGVPALDEEAVAMMRRASPVPAPPASVGGGSITLAVPVRFSR